MNEYSLSYQHATLEQLQKLHRLTGDQYVENVIHARSAQGENSTTLEPPKVFPLAVDIY